MPDGNSGLQEDRLRGSLDGDPFMQVLENHRQGLIHYISRRTRDYHAAEDLCQEALLRAHRARHTLDAPDRIKSWLYSIAYHVTVDWIRHRAAGKRSARTLDRKPVCVQGAPASDEALMRKEDRDRIQERVQCLWRLVPELPDMYREVFELRYRSHCPIAEIARMIGIPEGNVKVRLFRARRMLATIIAMRGFKTFFARD